MLLVLFNTWLVYLDTVFCFSFLCPSFSLTFHVGSEPGFGCITATSRPPAPPSGLPSQTPCWAGCVELSAPGCGPLLGSWCGCVRVCWGRGVTVGSVVAAYLPCHHWVSERTDWPSSCPTEGLARPLTEETTCPDTQHAHTHTYLIEINTFPDTYTHRVTLSCNICISAAHWLYHPLPNVPKYPLTHEVQKNSFYSVWSLHTLSVVVNHTELSAVS